MAVQWGQTGIVGRRKKEMADKICKSTGYCAKPTKAKKKKKKD